MASPQDMEVDDANSAGHKPFTVEENIHQLNAIDKSIVKLMSHTCTALNSLTVTPPASNNPVSDTDGPKPLADPAAQKDDFRSATDSFLTTLHSIDVRMKRQILALEEAGIVDLNGNPRAEPKGGADVSLKPSGTGAIGNLDVGWLNSRGTKVEREMEAELWEKARTFLEKNRQDIKLE
ncbi:hypothetical protein S7711_09735 [Stachybotrys chartarum IBT 7711]|uniref:Mediator of RNA polymerase II transcription subunit 11 n=1 Tax=Stachybotrys chartarum (strain CBS 109288 / IBT 7711) TaxID=1280523 RepID=A0A084AEU4_STACB|nr:hypothetical protein S7711_09735 [Stachybotrys chartarum IBT 7711]KFA52579.1 hypothetical protein S40293_07244 [Stachybotrys chartarum IBT 40293]KFA76670.1 hypothetical protein S40288_04406 [Stachybotrys chartarum IBT 40288]